MAVSYFLVNRCYGGFNFSREFTEEYRRRYEKALPSRRGMKDRSDPIVISLFDELGSEQASCSCAMLKKVAVLESLLPFVVINEYDGSESWGIDYNQAEAVILRSIIHANDDMDPSSVVAGAKQQWRALQEARVIQETLNKSTISPSSEMR